MCIFLPHEIAFVGIVNPRGVLTRTYVVDDDVVVVTDGYSRVENKQTG